MSYNLVSIGIVVYNTKIDTLKATFNSIKNFDCNNVFILCNSENIEYKNLIKGLCKLYSFNFINAKKNLGFGAAHNSIVEKINSKWYICCNPDIIIKSGLLNDFIKKCEELKDGVLITPKILNLDGSIQYLSRKHITLTNWLHRQLWRSFPKIFKPYEIKFDYSKTQQIEFVTGCFFAIKKEDFLKLSGFSNEFFLYCEDADLSRRAEKLGKNYYISTYHVYHSWEKAYTKSYNALKIEIKSLLTYFKKYGFF